MNALRFAPDVAREIVRRLSTAANTPECPLCGYSSSPTEQTRGSKQYRRCPRCGLTFYTLKTN